MAGNYKSGDQFSSKLASGNEGASYSDSGETMYQENVKAQEPSHKGLQYADSTPGAFNGNQNSNWLQVARDSYGNELAADRPYHQDTTAQDGSFNFSGNQYSGGAVDGPWCGGYGSSYGVAVTDNGKNPQVERTSVDVSRADRGKES